MEVRGGDRWYWGDWGLFGEVGHLGVIWVMGGDERVIGGEGWLWVRSTKKNTHPSKSPIVTTHPPTSCVWMGGGRVNKHYVC